MKASSADISAILKLPATQAAPKFLGCFLVRNSPQGMIKLKIVETESYNQEDPASHSYRGLTKRTAPMFEAGGTIYVYFTYGMHYCLNIVTGQEGRGEAVLIRAAEPVEGLELVRNNRGIEDIYQLASGPGKLTMALGITNTSLSGSKLGGEIKLLPSTEKIPVRQIVLGPRIGIKQGVDKPWRFYIKDNPFVSKTPAPH